MLALFLRHPPGRALERRSKAVGWTPCGSCRRGLPSSCCWRQHSGCASPAPAAALALRYCWWAAPLWPRLAPTSRSTAIRHLTSRPSMPSRPARCAGRRALAFRSRSRSSISSKGQCRPAARPSPSGALGRLNPRLRRRDYRHRSQSRSPAALGVSLYNPRSSGVGENRVRWVAPHREIVARRPARVAPAPAACLLRHGPRSNTTSDNFEFPPFRGARATATTPPKRGRGEQ